MRAVQTAIKYSTPERKRQIAKELEGTYCQLAESRYAKFMIAKLLVQNDPEIRDLIIPEFYGRVRKLINHTEASWILDDIYRGMATKEQKAILLREWYGPEFRIKELTKDIKPTADLKEILANEPSKRSPIMRSLLEMINSLIQKKLTGFTMLHDAMMQYFQATEPGTQEFTEFFEIIKGDEAGDLLKNLAFTPSGARLVCLLFAHGSAKDRKQLLKTYKDTFLMMSADAHAHVVILTAYDVIDDTKLTNKSIIPELIGEEANLVQNTIATANHLTARTVFLYPYLGLSKSLFAGDVSYTTDVLKEVHEIRKTTSKKDDHVRRQEIVAALAPSLLDAIAAAAFDLVSTPFGSQLVGEVLLGGPGDKEKALAAVAACAAGDTSQEGGEAEDGTRILPHASRMAHTCRLLKSLIQGGRFDKEKKQVVQVDPPLEFANALYPVIQEQVVEWATGPGAFVIVGLAEASDFSEQKAMMKTLKANKKALSKAATEETAQQKAAREADTQEGKANKKKKVVRNVGNAGSKLLLEKL